MKYIKRILIILFLVIMISGCKVKYKLKINDDLSVNEKVTVSENTNRMKSRTNLDEEQSVKYLYKIYKLDGMSDDAYTIVSSSYETEVVVNNNYKNYNDFCKKFSNDLFDCIIEEPIGNKQLINFTQMELIDTKASNRHVYDEIELTIELPFEVLENNADDVNGNKYTWYIKADSKDYKNIILRFNNAKLNDSFSFNIGKRFVNIRYGLVLILAVIVIIALAGLFVYTKNKKNNKM